MQEPDLHKLVRQAGCPDRPCSVPTVFAIWDLAGRLDVNVTAVGQSQPLRCALHALWVTAPVHHDVCLQLQASHVTMEATEPASCSSARPLCGAAPQCTHSCRLPSCHWPASSRLGQLAAPCKALTHFQPVRPASARLVSAVVQSQVCQSELQLAKAGCSNELRCRRAGGARCTCSLCGAAASGAGCSGEQDRSSLPQENGAAGQARDVAAANELCLHPCCQPSCKCVTQLQVPTTTVTAAVARALVARQLKQSPLVASIHVCIGTRTRTWTAVQPSRHAQ